MPNRLKPGSGLTGGRQRLAPTGLERRMRHDRHGIDAQLAPGLTGRRQDGLHEFVRFCGGQVELVNEGPCRISRRRTDH